MDYLSYKDIKEFRKLLLEKQNYVCPLCNQFINPGKEVLDHDHVTGKIRGVLHAECNSFEGMLIHKFIRSGVHKYCDIEDFLYNLIKYWNKVHYPILHPSEKPHKPNLKKSSYNRLKKKYTGKAKFPEYPKSKKLTKKLEELFIKYNIEPEFYNDRKGS